MKKFALILLAALTSCTNKQDAPGLYESREAEKEKVWICLGTSSHAFHASYNCKGIKACRGEKKQISAGKAYSMGRTPCHYCCDDRLYRDPGDPDTYDPMNTDTDEQ